MIQIRELIRLREEKKSERLVSEILSISRDRVGHYYSAFKKTGFSLKDIEGLNDDELLQLLDPEARKENDKHNRLVAFFPYMEKELKRTGVTRQILWMEYMEKETAENREAYGYSQFCHHFQQWGKKSEAVMHFDYKAGEKMLADFTGKKMKITDRISGSQTEVEIFVALLGASQLTYVEAAASQKSVDFIGAMENALRYFGGCPELIVVDNLKAAVNKASNYEPELNRNFEHFSEHCRTAVLACRAGKPRDKALVEGAVKIVYQRIFAPLRNEVFYTLGDLNKRIREELESYNSVQLTDREHSRRSLFEELERKALKPLPAERYEIRHFDSGRVSKFSYVELKEDKHYYSVPFQYIGKEAKICYTRDKVEIYLEHTRIAYHKREIGRKKYTTVKDHLPSTHRFVAEWNEPRFIAWAGKFGKETEEFITRLIRSKPHPEIAFKVCMGILNLGRESKYGAARLNSACGRALSYESYSMRTVENILKGGLDRLQEKGSELHFKIPGHENVRADYN